MFKALVRFLVLLVSMGVVHAQQCEEYQASPSQTGGWFSSIQAACGDAAAYYAAAHAPLGGSVTACALNGGTWLRDAVPGYSPTPYNIGISTRQGQCQSNCTAGQAKVVNYTYGYSREKFGEKLAVEYPNPWANATSGNQGSACYNGCKVNFGDMAGTFSSQTPTANGLYRRSLDMNATTTAESCTGSDQAVSPSAPIPNCPGSLGTVNGVPYCAGTSAQPVANDKPPPANAPPATPGNPAAGEKPSTGEGSGSGVGRTPSAGNGGPAGGPIGSTGAGGTVVNQNPTTGNPTGTVTRPGNGEVQANCGAPGQPKCAIDETGTPKGDNDYAKGLDAYKDALDQARGTIGGDSDKGFFNGWTSFFFAPPIVTCTQMALPDRGGVSMGAINPCPVVDGIRIVMAYLWALGAFYLCWGWVSKAATAM